MAPLEELDGRLPSLDAVFHPQVSAHKENLPFLVSKKWEAIQKATGLLMLRSSRIYIINSESM